MENELRKALENLLEVISAHELVSLSCDRDGQEFCDCLEDAVKQAQLVINKNPEAETFREELERMSKVGGAFGEWAKRLLDRYSKK